jgi:hypothetical protein
MKMAKRKTTKRNEQPVTLTDLVQEKTSLKSKIRKSEKQMKKLSQQLFTPTPAASKADVFFQAAKKGFALYDGIMMGYKVTKLMQSLLKVRKK